MLSQCAAFVNRFFENFFYFSAKKLKLCEKNEKTDSAAWYGACFSMKNSDFGLGSLFLGELLHYEEEADGKSDTECETDDPVLYEACDDVHHE